jgi:hypothetical protein
MSRSKSLLGLGFALVFVLTAGVGTASADLQLYDLTASNLGSIYTGPFIEVKVNLTDSTHATITFSSLSGGGYTFLMASGGGNGSQTVGANINGKFTLSSFTGTAYVSGAKALSSGSGKINGDSYEATVGTQNSALKNAYTEIVMNIVATHGNTWSGANSVLSGTPMLGAQIGALKAGAMTFATTGDANTPMPVSPVHAVPEPSTMLIAALGTMGFLGYGLRSRRKT